MGKNKARHILHGVLDCLPIILIPIFMIYSQNHDINDNSLQVQENKVVDFNQMSKAISSTGVSFTDEVITFVAPSNVTNNNYQLTTGYPYESGHKILLKADLISVSGDYSAWYLNFNINTPWYNSTLSASNDFREQNYKIFSYTANDNCVQRYMLYGTWQTGFTVNVRLQSFDLTKIFGVGNEPTTVEQFNYYFPADFYDFTLSKKVEIEDKIFTYNDTDIMSQSFYCLYNAVDKYFNMGNVFGMNNLYIWFEVNIFGGNASPSIYIVWNIVLYEFIMDLLFLLYGLFMFFIDLCKRLMEKPLNSIK